MLQKWTTWWSTSECYFIFNPYSLSLYAPALSTNQNFAFLFSKFSHFVLLISISSNFVPFSRTIVLFLWMSIHFADEHIEIFHETLTVPFSNEKAWK